MNWLPIASYVLEALMLVLMALLWLQRNRAVSAAPATEWDVEKLLARSQLGLSILILGCYFSLKIAQIVLKSDVDVSDMRQLVELVVFYWFQRQRPQTATDGNGNGHSAPNPSQPALTPANPPGAKAS